MGGTLRTQNFKTLSTPLFFKYKIAEQKSNEICSTVNEICLTKMTKIVILADGVSVEFPFRKNQLKFSLNFRMSRVGAVAVERKICATFTA
jgi:hypothetical protein